MKLAQYGIFDSYKPLTTGKTIVKFFNWKFSIQHMVFQDVDTILQIQMQTDNTFSYQSLTQKFSFQILTPQLNKRLLPPNKTLVLPKEIL